MIRLSQHLSYRLYNTFLPVHIGPSYNKITETACWESCFRADRVIPTGVTLEVADLMGVITAGAVVDLEELLTNVRDLVSIVPLNFTVDRVEGIASK
jgi:hypothetical protein